MLAQSLAGTPYGENAEGEGNWCSASVRGCNHVQQDPIFRTDIFDCNTLVNTILGLLHASNLSQFNQTILNVEYGAAAPIQTQHNISYCNRNNFVSADYNKVNQQLGFITDSTAASGLSPIKTQSAKITPRPWFAKQSENDTALQTHVRVLSDHSGAAMAALFSNNYVQNICPNLKQKTASLKYIPKSLLVIKSVSPEGKTTYLPNLRNENKIPTPAVIEFIRNDAKWIIAGQPISKIIGSGIIVSHMGFVYRKTFKQGDVIYQQISCSLINNKKVCNVAPVTCHKKTCTRVMFLAASNAYPDGYYFYKTNGHFVCTDQKPNAGEKYTACNRVFSMPIANYFTQYQYGDYPYIASASLLGINVQQLK